MSEPSHELEVEKERLPVAESGGSGAGEEILEALNRLTQRVDRLQNRAREEQSRSEARRQRLAELEAQSKRWGAERETILKTVEGLIHKVDSLEKQI